MNASSIDFAAVFHHAPVAMALLSSDGDCLAANLALAAALGFEAGEPTALVGRNLVCAQERLLASAWCRHLIENADADSPIELHLLRRDGLAEAMLVDGRALPIAGTSAVVVQVQKTSGLRTYIAAIETLARRYELILNAAAEGVVGLAADGTITFANVATAALLHLPLEDVMGRNARQLLPALFDGKPASAGQAQLQLPDGSGVPVEYRKSPIAADDRDAGSVIVFADISERLRGEQALAQSNTSLRESNEMLVATQFQLIQSEKLASLGRLAAGVAHEINNPINFVQANVRALEGYLDSLFRVLDAYAAAEPALRSDAAAHADIQRARREADLDFLRGDLPVLLGESRCGIERVRKVVQDLRDFARVDRTPGWELVNLHQCLDSIINLVRHEIGNRADIVKEYGDLPEVECVAPQINQVFLNLLINAGQAIPEHRRGTITLRTGRDGEQVFIEVADNGDGIAPGNIQSIFDPFFTTRPVGKGTGLGLSVSHGIVGMHGGSIGVESEPGRGTGFRVRLPIRRPSYGS